jgi:hypothetical protein
LALRRTQGRALVTGRQPIFFIFPTILFSLHSLLLLSAIYFILFLSPFLYLIVPHPILPLPFPSSPRYLLFHFAFYFLYFSPVSFFPSIFPHIILPLVLLFHFIFFTFIFTFIFPIPFSLASTAKTGAVTPCSFRGSIRGEPGRVVPWLTQVTLNFSFYHPFPLSTPFPHCPVTPILSPLCLIFPLHFLSAYLSFFLNNFYDK